MVYSRPRLSRRSVNEMTEKLPIYRTFSDEGLESPTILWSTSIRVGSEKNVGVRAEIGRNEHPGLPTSERLRIWKRAKMLTHTEHPAEGYDWAILPDPAFESALAF